MKRIALFTLLAFAATHVAYADDKKDERPRGRQGQAIAKEAPRPPRLPQRTFAQPNVQRPRPNVVAPSFRANQLQASQLRANQLRANQLRSYQSDLRRRDRTPQFTNSNIGPVVRQDLRQVEIARDARIQNQGLENQRQWNADNQAGNWRNHDNDRHDNWRNRSDSWRRRHGHWNRHHRNRSWWRSNFSRFALFGGGYYYWNGGYWYPAYGYDPYFSTYSYDAPIYAYNDQDPGQVIANVQVELQRRGYNPGGVDGSYGPRTRSALIRYQGDNGLPVTGEIDEDTLNSLGLQ